MDRKTKIYLPGHNGMVGSACIRVLKQNGFTNLIKRSSTELDLRIQSDVQKFFDREKPEVVINCAAKVGGILANNSFPYEFLLDNMLIQNNLLSTSHKNNVEKFIFLGSSCIYPKFSPQPIKEEYLLTDFLEPTNQWYALAKITGVKLVESLRIQYGRDYLSLMPTNLYGINDNFDLKSSHVLPALIRKFHEAKTDKSQMVKLWGTGSPMREFLYVDDLAKAVLFALENKLEKHIYNVGTGKDITIRKLAEKVQKIIGYEGEVIWDHSKPDGTPRKLLDISRLSNVGWSPVIDLDSGIRKVYQDFCLNVAS
jgi:GDP-L-fucose synthase